MGLPLPKFGYHIPHRYAGQIDALDEADHYAWIKDKWDQSHPIFFESLDLIRPHLQRLSNFSSQSKKNMIDPRFDQLWFSGIDAASAYAFVRELRPALILEIGSGHSTRFMAKAIEDGSLGTKHIVIDPEAPPHINLLCTEVFRRTVNQVPIKTFHALRKNDILFIDGSHIAMPGTDVDIMINRVLPTLKTGVWVHIHDILLPQGYPDEWKWRNYNEQTVLAALLAGGDKFRVQLPCAYVRKYMSDELRNFPGPIMTKYVESSLWLSVQQ